MRFHNIFSVAFQRFARSLGNISPAGFTQVTKAHYTPPKLNHKLWKKWLTDCTLVTIALFQMESTIWIVSGGTAIGVSWPVSGNLETTRQKRTTCSSYDSCKKCKIFITQWLQDISRERGKSGLFFWVAGLSDSNKQMEISLSNSRHPLAAFWATVQNTTRLKYAVLVDFTTNLMPKSALPLPWFALQQDLGSTVMGNMKRLGKICEKS